MKNKLYLSAILLVFSLGSQAQKYRDIRANSPENRLREYFIGTLSKAADNGRNKKAKTLCERLIREAWSTTHLFTRYYSCGGCFDTIVYHYTQPKGSFFDYGRLTFQRPEYNDFADPLSPSAINYDGYWHYGSASSFGIYFDSATDFHYVDHMACGVTKFKKMSDTFGNITGFSQFQHNPGCYSDSTGSTRFIEEDMVGYNTIDSNGALKETVVVVFDTLGHSDTAYRRTSQYYLNRLISDTSYVLSPRSATRWRSCAANAYSYNSVGLLDSFVQFSFDTATTRWSKYRSLHFSYTTSGQLKVLDFKNFSSGMLAQWYRDSLGYDQPYFTYRKSGTLIGGAWDTVFGIEYKHINALGVPDSSWWVFYSGRSTSIAEIQRISYDAYLQPTELDWCFINWYPFDTSDTLDIKKVFTYETYLSDCPLGNIDIPLAESINTAFPNPATDKITIRLAGIANGRPLTLTLLDVYGRVVLQESILFEKSDFEPDIHALPSGQYIISITDENQLKQRIRLTKW